MNVLDAIKTKRAVRQFTDASISRENIITIIKAGRRAQSSKNSQPWKYIVVQNRDTLKKLSELGKYADHLDGAAIAVVILTPDPSTRFSVMFDAGQSAAYMQLAAWELGIGSCLATIYEPEKAREVLGFPSDLHVRIALSFGYPSSPADLNSPPKKGGRIAIDQQLHWDHW